MAPLPVAFPQNGRCHSYSVVDQRQFLRMIAMGTFNANSVKKKGGGKMDASLTKILELAIQQGIWAVLYIYLFFRMLKENKEREARYQETITLLSGDISDSLERLHTKIDAQNAGHIENNTNCK